GAILGTVLGNIFGGDEGFGWYGMGMSAGHLGFADAGGATDDWDFGRPAAEMRDAAMSVLNSILAEVGGTSNQNISIVFFNQRQISGSGQVTDTRYVQVTYGSNWWRFDNPDANGLVARGVIMALKLDTFTGGDPYILAAISQSTALDLGTFTRQIA